VWEHAKRRCDEVEEEQWRMEEARKASIDFEMWRRGLVIVDYYDGYL
jgi:hypothetical protein